MNVRAMVLTLVLCCFGITACFAAGSDLGTWKLNEAKSKIAPGAPKNTTVTLEAAGDMVKVTVDGVSGEGKPTHNEWKGKYDGKDYPVSGDTSSGDARSYAKVDDNTMKLVVKMAGKTVYTGSIVLSADGKTRTVTVNGTNAKGEKFTSVSVYDKQ